MLQGGVVMPRISSNTEMPFVVLSATRGGEAADIFCAVNGAGSGCYLRCIDIILLFLIAALRYIIHIAAKNLIISTCSCIAMDLCIIIKTIRQYKAGWAQHL